MSNRRSKGRTPRPRWLRPPLVPLVYLLGIALPLSIWQSPGADRQATTILVASFALLILVAGTARPAPFTWARIYFATGAAMTLFHGRLYPGEHGNELAGIMLLFLPLAATLARCPALPPMHRLQTGLLTLLFGGTLLATGSRGGLLALLAAAGVVLLLERRWRLLLLGLAFTGALAASDKLYWLIYDGKAQGLTLDSLLTGRPEIWRRSLHAIADFSWTGIGVGAFPEVVPKLYYPAGDRSLEDAHSLVLQTALDLGVGGLLATAAIVWLALRQAWSACRLPRRRPAGHGAWTFGLFVSLLAFVVFNLFDAVALGSPGSPAFFILLGLIYALPRPRRLGRTQRRSWRGLARGHRRLLLGAIFMFLGLSSIRGARQLNFAAVLGARAVVYDAVPKPTAHAALNAASDNTCRAGWLAGKVAQAWSRASLRDQAWADLLDCDAAFVPMIAGELPDHRRLAEQAVLVQPSSAAAHLWLARIRRGARDLEAAERLYRRSLELDPTSGPAWLELGRLRLPEDPEAALDAFRQSCRHGDPGANACVAAGTVAEQLGDFETAIRYYRESRLDSARERAEQLASREDAQVRD